MLGQEMFTRQVHRQMLLKSGRVKERKESVLDEMQTNEINRSCNKSYTFCIKNVSLHTWYRQKDEIAFHSFIWLCNRIVFLILGI
jgi:hypothetical protein